MYILIINQYSPVEQDIEHKLTLIQSTPDNFSFCIPKTVKNIIKNLSNNKALGADKITAIKLKNLLTKLIVALLHL